MWPSLTQIRSAITHSLAPFFPINFILSIKLSWLPCEIHSSALQQVNLIKLPVLVWRNKIQKTLCCVIKFHLDWCLTVTRLLYLTVPTYLPSETFLVAPYFTFYSQNDINMDTERSLEDTLGWGNAFMACSTQYARPYPSSALCGLVDSCRPVFNNA